MTTRICVGDISERDVATLTAWMFGMLYNQKDFDPKEKRSTEDPYPSAPVRATQTSSTLFCSTPPFILGNNQRKQIIFYTCVSSSFCYIIDVQLCCFVCICSSSGCHINRSMTFIDI